jgi:hypothetical protein
LEGLFRHDAGQLPYIGADRRFPGHWFASGYGGNGHRNAPVIHCLRSGDAGGRRWWAHLAITRMNIARIILKNQIEDLIEIL